MEKVSVVSDRRCVLGEGPHWDDETQQLIYVDLLRGSILRLNTETKREEEVLFDGDTVSFAIPSAVDQNKAIISRNKQICSLNWATKETTLLGEVQLGARTRLNDGKCDCKGRLWTGTMRTWKEPSVFHDDLGCLYTLDSKNNIREQKSGLHISNGIAWDKANKKMFFIDSLPRQIYVYDFDADKGNISGEKTLIDFNANPCYNDYGLPDGMTIDENDKLWVACFNGGSVINIDSNTGTILKTVSFPTKQITSCTFGGKNYDTLYVTSAEKDSHPTAGAVFKVTELGIKGLPPNKFAN